MLAAMLGINPTARAFMFISRLTAVLAGSRRWARGPIRGPMEAKECSTWPTGRVLLVGEGDFSYASGLLCTANALTDQSVWPSLRLTATTLDSELDLPYLFPRAMVHINTVRS